MRLNCTFLEHDVPYREIFKVQKRSNMHCTHLSSWKEVCHSGDKEREIVMGKLAIGHPEEEGQRLVDVDIVYLSLPDYGMNVVGSCRSLGTYDKTLVPSVLGQP